MIKRIQLLNQINLWRNAHRASTSLIPAAFDRHLVGAATKEMPERFQGRMNQPQLNYRKHQRILITYKRFPFPTELRLQFLSMCQRLWFDFKHLLFSGTEDLLSLLTNFSCRNPRGASVASPPVTSTGRCCGAVNLTE